MLIQTLQGHFLNIFQQLKATDYVLDFIPLKKKLSAVQVSKGLFSYT